MDRQHLVDYYNSNAKAFIDRTIIATIDHIYERFVPHLPDGGMVLDAGCGSGRDSKRFLEMGYQVTAFDMSSEMVKHAASLTGLDVRQMTFDQVAWKDRFDGAWACASLLHVPKAEITAAIERLLAALKPGGVLFCSFKKGDGERMVDGRFFNFYTEETLRDLLGTLPDTELIDLWTTDQVVPDRRITWVNAVVRKVG
jgi:2-polyprenyl-3-methyl-5-hydroxy-6-metoxy-1,4-benzoquinol methylase